MRANHARRFLSHPPTKLCFGAGSNVMDVFFPVRQLPRPGDKQYFAHEKLISNTVVGGVTLNHLAWARTLGVPSALLALQGVDEYGCALRAKLRAMGVDASFVRASPSYTTSVSYILSEEGGERTILMNPASTSRMTGEVMAAEWGADVARFAGMVSTEVSQLPLSGVEWLLDAARAAGAPTVLDVDVPPSVATGAARLGTAEQLARCVKKADVVKATGGAVEELLALIAPGKVPEGSLEGLTAQLARATGAELAVITDGSRGAALAGGRGGAAVRVPANGGVKQVDATGAGDAYLGGLMAALHAGRRGGGLDTSPDALVTAGRLAGATGAACVEVVGALPVEGVSAARILALCPEAAALVAAGAALGGGNAAGGGGSSGAPPQSSAAAYAASLAADAAALGALPASPPAQTLDAFLATAAAARGAGSGSAVWTTGIGKAGLVAARLAASLRSLGVRGGYVPASEWAHGDLGALRKGDAVLAFSHSGATEEVVTAARQVARAGGVVFAVTGGGGDAPLRAVAAGGTFSAPASSELLGAVPTRSVCAQEAVGNALLSALAAHANITAAEFKAAHPGGAIGAARKDA